MNSRLRPLLALLFLVQLRRIAADATPAPAPEGPGSAESALAGPEAPRADQSGVKVVRGPARVKLGKIAELNLPEHYQFIGPDSLDRFFELTQNMRSGNEVGVVMAPSGWTLFFSFNDVGYIKDDEKHDLDAQKIYDQMAEGEKASNVERKRRGWDEVKMQGWATPPHYDEKTHNLKWAFKLAASRDQFKAIWVNENIRLLGRSGVMNLTLAGEAGHFAEDEAEAERLLANFDYVSGQRYAEFHQGDKIAKYGLAALVVGGAGAVALKTGLIAKFWKVIVFGVLAAGSALSRLWKKFIGKDPAK